VSAFTRRRFLLAAGAATAAAVGIEALWLEPRRVTVTRHRVGGGSKSLRVVQLSDLHLQDIHQFELDVASTVSGLAPDVIVLTGDSIDKRRGLPVLDAFLRVLAPETPKYAVLGNWDYWSGASSTEVRAVYERHRCRLLVNETVVHEHDGRFVHFSGADDLLGGTPQLASLTRAEPEASHVLLAHCPAFREHVERDAPGRFTCMLSGHTHGGQIRFFGYAPVLPRGSAGYVSGWYRGQARLPMYVSRGIGTSLVRARLAAPPEVSVFEIG
jgi:predicted MPP superfamily phosphohydrolase